MSDEASEKSLSKNENGIKKLFDLTNHYASLIGVLITIIGIISVFLAYTYERGYLNWYGIDIKNLDINFIEIIYGSINKFLGSVCIVGAYFHVIYIFQRHDGPKLSFKRLLFNMFFELVLVCIGYFIYSMTDDYNGLLTTIIASMFILIVFYFLSIVTWLITLRLTKTGTNEKQSNGTINKVCIAMISLSIAVLYFITYLTGTDNAKNKRNYSTLTYSEKPYVVLCETKSQYVITPCKTVKEGDAISLFFNQQNKILVNKIGIKLEENKYRSVENKVSILDGYAERNDILKQKSFDFAIEIVNFCKSLNDKDKTVLTEQLLNNGINIGELVSEAIIEKDKKKFDEKINGSLTETAKTEYLLRLLSETDCITSEQFSQLHAHSMELMKILNDIVYENNRNHEASK